ncbi:MAG: NAD(P)H-dependent oxidoreductase [Alphaproteobacteria bacterium]|nr:NAD(P)H-dependent oxidoreductase [Alphaproteobacteria bacterium]
MKKQKNKPIIIFGSSRDRGDTWNAIQKVIGEKKVPIVNLNDIKISNFDYDWKNADDDFIKVAEQMIESDPIILATPIYWYSVSAIMKTFLDRWTDLTVFRKELGRKLRGKTLCVITSYGATEGKRGFEPVLIQTAEYMGMKYGGCFFSYVGNEKALLDMNEDNAKKLAKTIFS